MSNEKLKSFPVQVDFERILQTIAARIYDTEFAFIRENVQNAIDAIRIQALRDEKDTGDASYRIDIIIESNACSIRDNGIGMNPEELRQNFWTMGSSGKNNPEARKAGCVGTFGIGGFANFGVCETLEVISRSASCAVAHKTTLSKSSFSTNKTGLPEVDLIESEEITERGTIVRGTRPEPFNKEGLVNYIKEYVQYVREPVYCDGVLLSQKPLKSPQGNLKKLIPEQVYSQNDFSITMEVFADDANDLIVDVSDITFGGNKNPCKGVLRLKSGSISIYKMGFRICPVNISSTIGSNGFF